MRLDGLGVVLREFMIRSATFPMSSAHAPGLLLSVFPDVIYELVSWETSFEASHPLSVGGNLDYG